MPGRTHRDRLQQELTEIRAELANEVSRLKPEEFDWAPAEGMKTYRQHLLEIGTMEKICRHWLTDQVVMDWGELWDAFDRSGPDPLSLLTALQQDRVETLAWLSEASEEKIQSPIEVHETWYQYFGRADIEPEEIFRWIARHEYYHLGQFISYRWMQGDDPNKRSP